MFFSSADICLGQSTLDLMFLLDGSGSVSKEKFEIVKNWVKNVSSSFNIESNKTQIGVLEYSDQIREK